MPDEFRLDPDSVMGFGKHLWRVSDGLAGIDTVGIFSAGAAACPGTDLERGLKRHAEREHDAIRGLSTGFDDFGTDVKRAVEAFVRADDQSAKTVTRAGDERL